MTSSELKKKRVAIIGGGPSGLFVLKKYLKSNSVNWAVHIFEKTGEIGPGMPYSKAGANREHVTNVSDNEVPELITDIIQWIKHEPRDSLKLLGVDPDDFHEFKVVPRLLFGKYLSDQFNYLRDVAKNRGIELVLHYDSEVIDVVDLPGQNETTVVTITKKSFSFDHVIICTGHVWPKTQEGLVPGYFDSPYPPSKLNLKLNHPVAIRGASLSAIDAIKTIARNNGEFSDVDGKISYKLSPESKEFRIVMHSISGLPAFRFHLENSSASNRSVLTENDIAQNRAANDGFVSLDYIFETKFKLPFLESDPEFYEEIKDLSLEGFVESISRRRESIEPFALFRAEYKEAEKSIRQKRSIHWKESLAELSYILNYPAKYLSAEDMLRLREILMPLISVIIAFVPQSSGLELVALHDAGILSLKAVDVGSRVEPQPQGGVAYHTKERDSEEQVYYKTYIDCVGQKPFEFEDFPFRSLIENQTITPAKIRFRSPAAGRKFKTEHEQKADQDEKNNFYLNLPGIAINDQFQVIDRFGGVTDRIFVMAVPFISGFNPDYSGLDFCERASNQIVSYLLNTDR